MHSNKSFFCYSIWNSWCCHSRFSSFYWEFLSSTMVSTRSFWKLPLLSVLPSSSSFVFTLFPSSPSYSPLVYPLSQTTLLCVIAYTRHSDKDKYVLCRVEAKKAKWIKKQLSSNFAQHSNIWAFYSVWSDVWGVVWGFECCCCFCSEMKTDYESEWVASKQNLKHSSQMTLMDGRIIISSYWWLPCFTSRCRNGRNDIAL